MGPCDQIEQALKSAFFPAGVVASENRIRLYERTAAVVCSNCNYWLNGMDGDVLDEFPAQLLVGGTDEPEPVEWNAHWANAGGKIYGGSMVALKWDPVWFKISAFNLPFPPFQLGSWIDVEDVDRDEAEALGLSVPQRITASVNINLDTKDLTRRFLSELAKLEKRL